MNLQTLDYTVVFVYGVFLLILAQWVSREKAGHQKDTQDYFLAGRALPWWAIGASLIAANISAEQIIGMSGSAYLLGAAIATYEWMAALTLVIVGKYLLPVFLKHRIYTMPQFLEQRYDHRVRMVMAFFWLGVYVFVNLTSILWLGAQAINTVTGLSLPWGLVGLGLFAAAYSLYGGLKAVALTDIIQVTLLVLGGLFIAGIALDQVAGRSLDPFMPTGEAAGWLRSVMNECQMLLHADDQSGVVNSLWFWGLGRLPAITRKPLEISCNTLLCKSFIGACDADSEPSDTSLFTTSGCLDGRQYGDMDRWISGLSETEARLRELLEQQGEELFLQSDNGLAVRYRHRMRFRFWKRDSFTKLILSQGSQA